MLSSSSDTPSDPARPDQPFIDPVVVPALYADQGRVERRSNALLSAKIAGRHVGTETADLLASAVPSPELIADVGCGTGRPARMLLQRFPAARLLAIDASATMLAAARSHLTDRIPSAEGRVTYLQADFHRLPLAEGALHAAVAVFCLYHSPCPEIALRELTRCVRRGGVVVLVTKSADSYRELDQLLATTGLDPDAGHRPSLYDTASGDNLPELAAQIMAVERIRRDQHTFRFRDFTHLADYLSTVPKYQFTELGISSPAALANLLRRRRGDAPFTTTSTITYVIARRT